MKFQMLTLCLFAATAAHADYVPGRERPIETAQMKITLATGSAKEVRSLELTTQRADGAEQALTTINVKIDGSDLLLRVTKISRESCGSTQIVARAPEVELTLIDHATRLCDDLRPFGWDASLLVNRGRINAHGNPEGVVTPQEILPAIPARGPIENADLNIVELDEKLGYGNIDSGAVLVDRVARKVTLTFFSRNTCPPHVMCIAGAMAPIVVKLPIKSIQKDGCGSTVITALRDQRPVDGLLKKIVIQDNRGRLCKDRRFGMTEVEYITEGSMRPMPTESHLYGAALAPIMYAQ